MINTLLTIVVPTLGRDEEFKKFLDSLLEQNLNMVEFAEAGVEVIVVDQNSDDRVSKHIDACRKSYFSIQNLKLTKKGLSNAKNAGLKFAQGTYVCFLDDDCWLEKDALAELLEMLRAEVPAKGYLISAQTPKGEGLVPHELKPGFTLSENNIKDSFFAPQIAQIYPTADCKRLGGFNLKLGVGTAFGSAEDTDMLVRLVESGISFDFLPHVVVRHPEVDYQSMTADKSYAYGLGFGAFCKIHGWSSYWRYKMFRSLVATFLFSVMRPKKAWSYWSTLRGRFMGYRTWEKVK